MAKSRVTVVEKDGEFFAEPPVTILAAADKLKIINATSEDLVFRFEAATVLKEVVGGVAQPVADVLREIRSGRGRLYEVDGAAPEGRYPFQLMMVASGKKAKGNSDPVLIIEV